MVDPKVKGNFPSPGFQYCLAFLARISFNHIWNYLIEEVQIRKKLATEERIAKVYNFMNPATFNNFFQKRST